MTRSVYHPIGGGAPGGVLLPEDPIAWSRELSATLPPLEDPCGNGCPKPALAGCGGICIDCAVELEAAEEHVRRGALDEVEP